MKYRYLLSLVTLLTLQSALQGQRVGPKEVTAEINRLQDGMKQDLQDQLIEFTIRAASRPANSTLAKEVRSFLVQPTEPQGPNCSTEIDLKGLKALTPEQREHVLRSLSLEAREQIFDELSLRLMGQNPKPFRIPAGSTCISQIDTFYLLVMELVGSDPRYEALRKVLVACYGAPTALSIRAKFNDPRYRDEVDKVIPQSFKDNFFTLNPARVAIIMARIQTLTNTYGN